MYYVYAEVVSDSADQLSASCSGVYHSLYVCLYVCMQMCVCVCMHNYVCDGCTYACMYTYVRMCMCAGVDVHIQSCDSGVLIFSVMGKPLDTKGLSH